MPSSNARIVKVHTTFRNLEGTDAIKTHVSEKIGGTIQKFVHQDTEAHVVLNVEKTRHIAEVSFRSDGADFACKEESVDMYASVDKLSETLSHQLRKHKEKLKSH